MAAKATECKSARVDAVKAFAVEHYNEGGWDIVVETMSDWDIYHIVKHQLSEAGAIKKMAKHIGAKAEQREEIQSLAGGEDKDVPAELGFDPKAPNGYFKNGKPKPVSKARMAELAAAGVVVAA